ncbi:carbohydrate ABC transporter permease [Streptomyces sp. PT12]|uniref:carbohydrate ABC transporter permease n=1 Tax=Streptomyces sp. PT12 TaxID=1510197 RepID=UPI000DE47871|nr:carbohydrate ABC transporter permease [Streptomyces sp. PT12]RBM24377.1 sugar ABC transporter permease [Streptomyces sp. PT12]
MPERSASAHRQRPASASAPEGPASPLRQRRVNVGPAAVWTSIAFLAVLTVLPLVYMVSTAFKQAKDVYSPSVIPDAPTLDNFRYVFSEIPLARYAFNSLLVAVAVTVLSLLFHSMAGYALARLSFRGRDTIFAVIYATLLISLPLIMVPLFLVAKSLGILDSYLGMILPAVFNAFGIFFLRQFYLSFPDDIEEAARIDGCGYWRVYWSMILPMSRPLLSALAVFFFLATWNSFLWPLTIIQNADIIPIQVGISNFQGQFSAAWNYSMAASTVAALPTLVLFFVFQKQFTETIKTSGSR